MRYFVILFSFFFLTLLNGCVVEEKLPYNAVVLEQVIFTDEVIEGVPQTIQMPNGKAVTYKMPAKLQDGQLLKVRDVKGEPPYYIRVSLKIRDAKAKK